MRTPEEIMGDVNNKLFDSAIDYKPLMLEIMCNIAITLEKIAKEMNNDNQTRNGRSKTRVNNVW